MGKVLISLLVSIALLKTSVGLTNLVDNGSFESGGDGWVGFVSSQGKFMKSIQCAWSNDEEKICDNKSLNKCTFEQRDAPPDGKTFAIVAEDESIKQSVSGFVKGKTYELRLWARGINNPWGGYQKVSKNNIVEQPAIARVSFGSKTVDVNVGYPIMRGAAAANIKKAGKYGQDDGANVWVENGVRIHAGNGLLFQDASKHPIRDEWKFSNVKLAAYQMALAPVHVPGRLRAIGGTDYNDNEKNLWSKLIVNPYEGQPNKNSLNGLKGLAKYTVLEHRGSEKPWVIDSHYFYDEGEERLWMSWGGHEAWITEVSPDSGYVCCTPKCSGKIQGKNGVCSTTKFTDHDSSVHTKILDFRPLFQKNKEFEGDGCGVAYMEGPAIHRGPDGSWFAFASWGSMSTDYTIRVCRSNSPRGPYKDKEGNDCAKFENGMYGSSMLLGPEGPQSVPGHPHFWKEGDVLYMGYDFRKGAPQKSNGQEGYDFMAIREIHWLENQNGAKGFWPTIWTPITIKGITAQSNDDILLDLSNVGGKDSKVAFDLVEVYETNSEKTSTPTKNPTKEPTSNDSCASLEKKKKCKTRKGCTWKRKKCIQIKCEDFKRNKRKCMKNGCKFADRTCTSK